MTAPDITSISVAAGMTQIAGMRDFLDAITRETGLNAMVCGPAVRDLIAEASKPVREIDVLLFGDGAEGFKNGVSKVAAQFQAKAIDYPGSHIVFVLQGSGLTFEVQYPKKSALEGLLRSELTVNAVGFLWKEQRIEDPFGGVADLNAKKLAFHSPQYAMTNPANFPRVFRTAAALGFKIEGETEQIMRRCAGMISLSEGKTNLRVAFELLKFLSLPAIAPYLRQFHQMRLIEALFPELTIPAVVGITQTQTILDRNVEFAAMIDSAQFSEDLRQFMEGDLGLGISNRGILRLITFFLDIGGSYAAFKNDAPYVKFHSNPDLGIFVRRIEQSLLGHIAARYREAREVAEIFTELPVQLAFARELLAAEGEKPPPEGISAAGKVRAQILVSGLRSLRKQG